MPQVPKKRPGIHSTRWRTTSRATHPSHGAGLSHAPSGTASTRCGELPRHLPVPLCALAHGAESAFSSTAPPRFAVSGTSPSMRGTSISTVTVPAAAS